jgi:hypothetical protein
MGGVVEKRKNGPQSACDRQEFSDANYAGTPRSPAII